jgi:hypothetical protein
MFLDYPSLGLGLRCLNRNCFRCCRVGAGSNGEGGILDHLTQHDPLPPPRITKHAEGGSTPILCRDHTVSQPSSLGCTSLRSVAS